MNVPTKNDWSQLVKTSKSCIEIAVEEIEFNISFIDSECEKFQKRIDWNWEVFTDADGQPKAVYWDDATESERDMLDYFAKFEYAKKNVMEKLKQAHILIGECKEIMNGITE